MRSEDTRRLSGRTGAARERPTPRPPRDGDRTAAAPAWDYPRASAGVRTLVEAGADRGVPARSCLRLTGIAPADLDDGDLVVEAGQELQVMRNLVAAVDDPRGLGVDVGRRFTVGSFGIWGYALLTSVTWADVVDTGLRFARLSYAFVHPTPTDPAEGHGIALGLDGVPDDLADFVVERDLAAAIRLFTGIGGGTAPLRFETRLAGATLDALRAVVPTARVTGARPFDRVLVDAGALGRRPPQADPVTRDEAGRACDDLLQRRSRRRGVAARVRAALLRDPAARPTMSTVAAGLNVDGRTLRRHLAAEGTSFQELRDEVHRTLAIELLTTAGLTVDEVRRRLGYADAASFTHAFRRWTGATPGAWRRDGGTLRGSGSGAGSGSGSAGGGPPATPSASGRSSGRTPG